jgi:DNA-binding SARP family transcriptional activator
VIEQDNKDKANASQQPTADSAASFKKAEDETAEVLTEEEKGYLEFMKEIAENFDQQEITILTQIIIKLEEDTAQLRPVAELLNIDISDSLKKQNP